jgi:UDP-galactopyranose mutase
MSRLVKMVIVGLGLQAAASASALEFTADRITKMDGRTSKAHIYYRDSMWRIEHHALGPVNVSIVRKDKQVVWLLLSRMKHFKTVPYNAEQDLMVTERLDGEVSREEIGRETREGHPTVLYEVSTKQGERTEVYYQWVATDIHFPMKLAKKDGSWIMEYQHVKMRAVSDYLFQLPVNFQPLEDFKKATDAEPHRDR